MRDRFILCFSASLLVLFASAQQIDVRGGFVQDYYEVGDAVDFWVTAKYPKGVELIFPDSTYNFTPFEWTSRTYYPSKLLPSGLVSDSAIYTFQCYEIDPVQYLKIPGIVLSKGDSTLIQPAADSILFHNLTTAVSDTTVLKTNTAYTSVDGQFNYPMMWIILAVLLVLAIVAVLLFGKKVMKALKLRKLKREYIRFSDQLTLHIRDLRNEPEHLRAERALNDWKVFAEKLENKPYTRMTTKEILGLEYTDELRDSLRNIDQSVYSGKPDEELYRYFQNIEDFTQHRYAMVVDEIKHGK